MAKAAGPQAPHAKVGKYPMAQTERHRNDPSDSRLRLQTAVRLRWFGVIGQLLTVCFVYLVLGFDLPFGICLAFIALSAWLNVFLHIRYPVRTRLSTPFATSLLAYDIFQLSALLYLTGGIDNPFSFLLVARGPGQVRSMSGREVLRVTDPTPAGVPSLVAEVAASRASVLILGETGAGKEVLAETVHVLSRRTGPLMRINCAALSESLLESELFGHEKGAFTGAVAPKVGLLEGAEGGTVFLDEVGELPPSIQAKLLRAVERREVLRKASRFIPEATFECDEWRTEAEWETCQALLSPGWVTIEFDEHGSLVEIHLTGYHYT